MCIATSGDAGASDGDAEDIVQELPLAIHLKRATRDQTRSIGPWIAVIVHNKLVDSVRRRGRHPSVPSEDLMNTLGVEDQNDGLSIAFCDLTESAGIAKTRQNKALEKKCVSA
jgi:DNA-directed RNA polymerase specialized sigma24 family protein